MLNNEETILKEIVWGERPPHHLSFVKIKYTHTRDGHRVDNIRDLNVVAGTVDIARGLLRYHKEPQKLKLWATLFEDVPEVFSLSLSRDAQGDLMANALKCAAGDAPIDENALALARQLVPAFPKKRFLGEALAPDTKA